MKKSKQVKKAKPLPRKRRRRVILYVLTAGILIAVLSPILMNLQVIRAAEPLIVTADECVTASADCILVLGCGVQKDGTLSDMLTDRVQTAVNLYLAGASPKLLMSGDHGREDYDEVNAMKDYAMTLGVPDEDIFMDHAGFSTYESVYRAKAIFGADTLIIVTQKYHLYRALYIAKSFGLDARGVSADLHVYGGQEARDIREMLGRCKDVLSCIFKPAPTYLGDAIPVSGDGNITNG